MGSISHLSSWKDYKLTIAFQNFPQHDFVTHTLNFHTSTRIPWDSSETVNSKRTLCFCYVPWFSINTGINPGIISGRAFLQVFFQPLFCGISISIGLVICLFTGYYAGGAWLSLQFSTPLPTSHLSIEHTEYCQMCSTGFQSVLWKTPEFTFRFHLSWAGNFYMFSYRVLMSWQTECCDLIKEISFHITSPTMVSLVHLNT